MGLAPAAQAAPAPDIKVTQSYSESIVSGDGVSCNDGVTVSDTQYWRRFDLSTYGASGGFSVSKMTIAVEVADSSAGNVPGAFSVYALDHAATLTIANLGAPLATVPVNYDSVADGAQLTAAIAATIPAGKDMVIEASVANSTTDEVFFPGANEDAELGLTYLTSASCATPQPTPIEDLVGVELANILFVSGKTTDCKNAETAATNAATAAATASANVAKATAKVSHAKKSLKKAKKSHNASKIKKAKKKLKKAKKALKAAQAASAAANAALATATATQGTKCAQPALPPAPARPAQGSSHPSTGATNGNTFSTSRS